MKRENQSYLNILSWKAKRNLVEKQLGKIPMKEQLQFQFARENKTILLTKIPKMEVFYFVIFMNE